MKTNEPSAPEIRRTCRIAAAIGLPAFFTLAALLTACSPSPAEVDSSYIREIYTADSAPCPTDAIPRFTRWDTRAQDVVGFSYTCIHKSAPVYVTWDKASECSEGREIFRTKMSDQGYWFACALPSRSPEIHHRQFRSSIPKAWIDQHVHVDTQNIGSRLSACPSMAASGKAGLSEGGK